MNFGTLSTLLLAAVPAVEATKILSRRIAAIATVANGSESKGIFSMLQLCNNVKSMLQSLLEKSCSENMARNWVEFDEGPKLTDRDRLYVSINKDAEILINRHTYEQMKEPAAVVLLFDSSTYTIGLRPASPLAPNAFPVKQKGRHGNRLVAVRGFVERYELRPASTLRFLTPAIDEGTLVLEYRRTANVSRNSKPGRR